MGRILLHSDPDQARAEFEAAKRFYEYSPSAELHQAYAASQLASLELARNNPERAMLLIGPHIDTAARHENAALLSTLMM
ncbi:hypothetical protein Q4528_13665, partial [Staphylococcus pasteuri_A]|nr:hypothetical protein [Staphylococcus pasteuri_A]